EGARLALVEQHVGAAPHAHLGNVVSGYRLARGASLDLLQVQDAAASSTLLRRDSFRLGEDALLSAHGLELGAAMQRHEVGVDLAGRGARLVSRGAFALTGRQHGETRFDVRHLARDTGCDISWRG